MDNIEFKNKLSFYGKECEITFTEEQKENFFKYYKLLIEWNEKFNLTSIIECEDVIKKHFIDSILPISLLNDNSKIIDIGSGAGFPSIPLKIMNPSLDFTLIDSVNKKVIFLNEVISQLQFKNIIAMHSRIEDLAHNAKYRQTFDYCVSRAVAPLNTLLEYSIPFLKKDGKMVAYKSININEEKSNCENATKMLGGDKLNIFEFDCFDLTRNIVVTKKIKDTPNQYPRSKNKPRLQPLT